MQSNEVLCTQFTYQSMYFPPSQRYIEQIVEQPGLGGVYPVYSLVEDTEMESQQ